MDNNIFFNYKETQAYAGYRSAILYKKPTDTKYRFLCASETVPFFGETKESFDFNLLNSPVMGRVSGKETVEDKEVELLYNRNNALMFEKLKDTVLDFMSLTPQLIGYKATGTISFRANDATADIHRGTYTITPMDVDPNPYFTAREEVLTPMFFASAIPDEISLSSLGKDGTPKIDVRIKGGSTATYSYDTIVSTTNKETGAPQSVTADQDGFVSLPSEKGLYVIYAEPAEGDSTHSGCFTTIYITD